MTKVNDNQLTYTNGFQEIILGFTGVTSSKKTKIKKALDQKVKKGEFNLLTDIARWVKRSSGIPHDCFYFRLRDKINFLD